MLSLELFLLLSIPSSLALPTSFGQVLKATAQVVRRTVSYGATTNNPVTNNIALTNWYEQDPTKGVTPFSGDPSSFYNCKGPMMPDFPTFSEWLSFDEMWTINQPQIVIANSNNGADYSSLIRDTILKVAGDSKVDARLILAVVMQESTGNVNIQCTDDGHCGLMQILGASKFDASNPSSSILAMIQAGVYGVDVAQANNMYGEPGLVQLLNGLPDSPGWEDPQFWGNPYAAVHAYNGGKISGPNLAVEEYGNPKTKVYANDIASRLTGWNGAYAGCIASTRCPTQLRSANDCY